MAISPASSAIVQAASAPTNLAALILTSGVSKASSTIGEVISVMKPARAPASKLSPASLEIPPLTEFGGQLPNYLPKLFIPLSENEGEHYGTFSARNNAEFTSSHNPTRKQTTTNILL